MSIPNQIQLAIKTLERSGFEAYIVGGCVRDVLRGKAPSDWDITTNAAPEQIQSALEKAGYKTFYENKFGTVTALTDSEDPTLKEIEITPFRTEAKYTDKRHPDEIKWAKKLKDDLSRRDFTVNALALTEIRKKSQTPKSKLQTNSKFQIPNSKFLLIDLFKGQNDLKNKIIRAVGKPEERFSEDALRLIRAVRFAVSLDPDKVWEIEPKTEEGIKKNSPLLALISQERIRDELIKIIMSPNGAKGIELLRRLGLLKYVIPELELGFNIAQNKHHIYQIYQHCVLSLNYACKQGFSLPVRLAALLHDIAKPKTKRGQGPGATFHGHEVVGAKITSQILRRLKFPKKALNKITKLTRYHLFYYNVNEVGPSSVRRLLRNVGQDDIEELLQVRYADRIGSGVPKAEPYKLRHLKYLLDKVSQDPIKTSMLNVSGDDVMKILGIKPGPRVGHILSYLLSQVLSDPKNNEKELLEQKIKELGALSEKELQKLAQEAKKDIEKVETKQDQMTKQKYWVT